MDPIELLARVADTLDNLRIPYFVTGSVATSAYGEYRGTADVDIVARIEARHVPALVAAFPADRYYISPEAIRDAVARRGQFNIIDSQTGYKADLIIPGQSEHENLRFERAVEIQPVGSLRAFWFSSPEDVILKKLEFHREGGSDKHLRDITGIINAGSELDEKYIQHWAGRLDVADLWALVKKRAAGA